MCRVQGKECTQMPLKCKAEHFYFATEILSLILVVAKNHSQNFLGNSTSPNNRHQFGGQFP